MHRAVAQPVTKNIWVLCPRGLLEIRACYASIDSILRLQPSSPKHLWSLRDRPPLGGLLNGVLLKQVALGAALEHAAEVDREHAHRDLAELDQ